MRRLRRPSSVLAFAERNVELRCRDAALRSTERRVSATQRRTRGTGTWVGGNARSRSRNANASSMDVIVAFIDDDLGPPERNVAFKEPDVDGENPSRPSPQLL